MISTFIWPVRLQPCGKLRFRIYRFQDFYEYGEMFWSGRFFFIVTEATINKSSQLDRTTFGIILTIHIFTMSINITEQNNLIAIRIAYALATDRLDLATFMNEFSSICWGIFLRLKKWQTHRQHHYRIENNCILYQYFIGTNKFVQQGVPLLAQSSTDRFETFKTFNIWGTNNSVKN